MTFAPLPHALSRDVPPRPSVMSRAGIIQFTQAAWAGEDQGVDFPMVFASLGMVPIEVGRLSLMSRLIPVTYRWPAFREISDSELVPEYTVTAGYSSHIEPVMGTVSTIDRICFSMKSSNFDIRVACIDNDWVINPTESEWASVGGYEIASTSPSHNARREVVRHRRIVVR